MLHIELVREMPEALKPRRIEIARPQANAVPPQIGKSKTVDAPETVET
jgi:molecular chaperone IbpA